MNKTPAQVRDFILERHPNISIAVTEEAWSVYDNEENTPRVDFVISVFPPWAPEHCAQYRGHDLDEVVAKVLFYLSNKPE